MKSKFYIIAALACTLALTACGGGNKAATAPVVAQPDYKQTDLVAGSAVRSDKLNLAENGDLIVVNANGWLYDAGKPDGKGDKLPTTVVPTANININSGKTESYTQGVGIVIGGRDKGTLGMTVGGTRRLVIPAALAYNQNGLAYADASGKVITVVPANAALVYDIELVSVAKATKPVVQPDPTELLITNEVSGTGPTAVVGSAVTINYTVWLYDGSRSDLRGVQVESSLTTGVPYALTLGSGNAIKGWHQGIPGMAKNGKRTLIVPASLAYGADGHSPTIPPNTALVFDVVLVTLN
jgi:peptidylprolyl isomerase